MNFSCSTLCILLCCGAFLQRFSATATPVKGIGRIINGYQASRGQFPWQAAIFVSVSGGTTTCGGSLITDQWILTAGHCVYRASSFKIYLGSTSLVEEDPDRLVVTSYAFILHEQYSALTLSHDIGLISLPEPVLFSATIRPIALPTSELLPGTVVTASGWGLTSDDGDSATENLNYAELVIIPDSKCEEVFGQLDDGVVCGESGGSQVVATCEGDSGGPVVTNIDSYPVLAGIVSFGNSDGCESGEPEGYTRTYYYREWIRNKSGV